MRTIIYTGYFRFPAGDAAASRVLNNAKILRKLGYNVVFISLGGVSQVTDKKSDGHYCYQGFRYINTRDIDVKQSNFLKRVMRFVFSGRNALNIISRMISEVDSVIAYQPSLYFTIQMKTLCKLHHKNLITDLTEWYAPNDFPGGIFVPPAWLNEWNMRIVQKQVKNKIVISSYLNRYYKSSNNIIIPPLVDSQEEKWSNHKKVLPEFDGVRIVYAGTPAKKDALETMLEGVLTCIKDGVKLQFVIVGVRKENITHYKNINDVLFYSENILLCGRVPQTLVPSYYKASDFSLLIRNNSRKSKAGFPTKLAEAITAGCPIITNKTSDIGHFIKSGYNGILLENSSLDILIKTLKEISQMSVEKIELMKRNSKESALEMFDYSRYTDKTKVFINDLKLL